MHDILWKENVSGMTDANCKSCFSIALQKPAAAAPTTTPAKPSSSSAPAGVKMEGEEPSLGGLAPSKSKHSGVSNGAESTNGG